MITTDDSNDGKVLVTGWRQCEGSGKYTVASFELVKKSEMREAEKRVKAEMLAYDNKKLKRKQVIRSSPRGREK